MTKNFATLIPVEQLSSMLKDDNLIIIDCTSYLDDVNKGRIEYLEDHIPGAVYMDLVFDLSGPVIKGVTGRHPLPDPEIIAAAFRNAGVMKTSQVVVYDRSNGSYAARAWWLLSWLNYHNCAVLNGGYNAWKNYSSLKDNQWSLNIRGDIGSTVNNELVVGRKDLEKLNGCLIDSRDYKRYTGEFEPIDPVAGHIPGAICLPFMDNINNDGIWKSEEELCEKFTTINNVDDAPVFYCGSGVTACHNVLAYKIATGKNGRLYPGSWSEWINYYSPGQNFD